jgi:hypothetical protein
MLSNYGGMACAPTDQRGMARVYRQNICGENFGALGKGLPTDRFLVEWWIKSDRVQQRHDRAAVELIGADSPIANACSGVTGARPQPRRANPPRGNPQRLAGDQENQHGAGAGLARQDARPV